MFNPTPQRAAPQAWAPNTVLQTVRQADASFENTDWENVPRLDYRTEKFRQLAVPDPARVVEDPSEFEPWKPQQLGNTSATDSKAEVEATDSIQQADAQNAAASTAEHDASPAGLQGEPSSMDDPQADAPLKFESQTDPEPDADAGTDNAPASAHADSDASAAGDDADTAPAQADAASSTDQDADDAESAATQQPDTGDASHDPVNAPEPGLDSAAVQEACDTARREGVDQGREEGVAQGREEAQAQAQEALKAALEQAEADKVQALQQLREELEGEIAPIKKQLDKAAEQVQSLVGQPDKLYEHVKRLSLHLAEQLVLGELNMSPAAIERLIQRCLDELDLHGNHVVTVELNPQDKARLQERAGELSHSLSLQAVQSLQPGSVRVMINDTMVEDLVGNRLDALARGLLVQPEVWREQSPFFRQPLAQRDTDIQDAAARVVPPRDTAAAMASAVRPDVTERGAEPDMPDVDESLPMSSSLHDIVEPADIDDLWKEQND